MLRFGAVRTVSTAPGLYFKLPAPFEQVFYLDNRILDLDLPAQEIIASDQKRLVVDAFTRYRITDPLRFFQVVNNIPRAQHPAGLDRQLPGALHAGGGELPVGRAQ